MLFISVISSASTIFILVTLIGGLVGYLYLPFWKLRKVPGPPSLPLVGHLPLLAKYGPDVFSVLAKQYGPIYRFLYSTCIHTIYHFIYFSSFFSFSSLVEKDKKKKLLLLGSRST